MTSQKPSTPPGEPQTSDADSASTKKMRRRQFDAANAMQRLFGPVTKMQSELWVRRTFLLIVTKVYEQLVNNQTIAPKEVMELTKAFAECCKVDVGSHGESTLKTTGKSLTDGLQEVVDQVYGASMSKSPTDAEQPLASAP